MSRASVREGFISGNSDQHDRQGNTTLAMAGEKSIKVDDESSFFKDKAK